MPNTWHYFDAVRDPLIVGLEPELISMLDMARGKSGLPFVISSGLRTPEQNAHCKGSALHSEHLPDENGLSKAVDLVCGDDHLFWSMLFGLYMAGFRRFGFYYTLCQDNIKKLNIRHIHADIATDIDHPIEVIWSQMEQN